MPGPAGLAALVLAGPAVPVAARILLGPVAIVLPSRCGWTGSLLAEAPRGAC
jgi:hypothetical protein